MSQQSTESTETATQSVGETVGAEGQVAQISAAETTETADEETLGDAGKKALDAMKAKWKEAEAKAKVEAEQRAALQAKLDGKEAEHQQALEAQRVKDEAISAANKRILSAEVRAAATGKLADPADALIHIDLSSLEVGDDGSVDTTAIKTAIDNLISTKPYLAAQGSRFEGSADGGTRNESTKSIDVQIAEATKAGNHQLAIALKQKRSADLLAKKS